MEGEGGMTDIQGKYINKCILKNSAINEKYRIFAINIYTTETSINAWREFGLIIYTVNKLSRGFVQLFLLCKKNTKVLFYRQGSMSSPPQLKYLNC